MAQKQVAADKEAGWTLRVLDGLFGDGGGQQVGVRLWDGTPWADASRRHPALGFDAGLDATAGRRQARDGTAWPGYIAR